MFRKLSHEQRNVVAEKLMEWGNLVFVGLVIAQFVPPTTFIQWGLLVVGLLGMITGYVGGYFLMKWKGGD